jgi:hypothetical protein
MIRTVSEPLFGISEKEQLKVAAQKIMTQILLNPGEPADWGSNVEVDAGSLKTFGLAKYGESTREAYVLDPDKVIRLTLPNTDPLYIPPSRVVELLNLGNDYGFAIELYPALNVDINKTSYEVSVTSEQDGLPIYFAKVYAKMYYYNESSQRIESTFQINTNTWVDGKCIVDFGVPAEKRILILVVDYYGVRITKVVDLSETKLKRACLLDNCLYGAGDISDNAMEIMVNKKAGNYLIENVIYSSGKDIEPSTVAVLAISKEGSDFTYAFRLPGSEDPEEARLTYSSIEGVWSYPFAYSVERSVIICGSAYIVRLYIWRMSF